MDTIKLNLATFEYLNKAGLILGYTGALIVIVLFTFTNMFFLSKNKEEVRQFQKKMGTLASKRKLAQIREQKKMMSDDEKERIRKTCRILNKIILQDIFPWTTLLDRFEDILPKGMVLTRIAPEDHFNQITITGRANEMADISQLMATIKASNTFEKNTISSLNVASDKNEKERPAKGKIGFELKITPRLSAIFPKEIYAMYEKSLERILLQAEQ